MENKILNQLIIDKNCSIKEAMRIIDLAGWGMGFVVDGQKKLLGVVTDGDIRRAIFKGLNILKPIEEAANKNPIFVREKTKQKELVGLKTSQSVRNKMPVGGSLKVPVLDDDSRIKDIVFVYERGMDNKPESSQNPIKKVLLIGGAGYLGSVLCRKLLNEGYNVKILDNLSYGSWGIEDLLRNTNFEFIKGDIRNISDIVKSIKNTDVVIHLAAIVGDPACTANPEQTLETNYLATQNIINACKYFQVNRLIFASTCSVYGQSLFPDQKLDEESPLNPVSLYAETKIKCERSILEAMDENFSPAILRMATLYGYSPNMRFDLAVNFMSAKAMLENKITVFGGEQWRPWLHLEDASSAYLNCLRQPINKIKGEVFNVVSENHKIIEIGKEINLIFPQAKVEISGKEGDKRNYNVSFDKISDALNFMPQKRVADGIVEIKKIVEEGLVKDINDPKYRISLPQV